MRSITLGADSAGYTAARKDLASTMDRVCADRMPLLITRDRGQSVVMLSLADYESIEEAAYLLRSPANAKRLLEAIEALKLAGGVIRITHSICGNPSVVERHIPASACTMGHVAPTELQPCSGGLL